MRICLTGSSGFLGSHLCRELADAGHEVYGVDLLPPKPAAPFAATIIGDLLDVEPATQTAAVLDYVLTAWRPEVVVHFAAQVGRLFGEDDLAHTFESNVLMSSLVARSCTQPRDRPRLVYTSTSEVYGDLGQGTAAEDDGIGHALAHNAYGLSKKFGEETSAMYALAGDWSLTGGLQVLRPSMPYGPGLPPGRGRAAIVNMLWQAHNEQPITVHRGAERSWCWIGDAVRGIRNVIEHGEVAHSPDAYLAGFGCYNVGRDDAATLMHEVAEIACDLTGASYDLIVSVDAPARQTVVKRLATAKLRTLGWHPEVELVDGMGRTLRAMDSLGQLAR